MVCFYHFSFLDLPVRLLIVRWSISLRACKTFVGGGYVLLNDTDHDRAEQNICCNCVDELQGRGKSDTLKKVGDSTV